MNYNSQLLGWAIDRITEAQKVGIVQIDGMPALLAAAKDLAATCYIPDSDFNDCIQRIVTILKEDPDALDKVKQLQSELDFIEEDLNRQIALRKPPVAASPLAKESVN